MLTILFTPNPSPSSRVITEVISYIVNDFFHESCHLAHAEIVLYSNIPEADVQDILQEVESALPLLDLSYQSLTLENNQCLVKKGDLAIKLPDDLWKTQQGRVKCGFQSSVENIYGTLEFNVITRNGAASIDNPQLFSTIVGYIMPDVKN